MQLVMNLSVIAILWVGVYKAVSYTHLYTQGYTRVTMAGTEGRYQVTGCQSQKPVVVRIGLAEFCKCPAFDGTDGAFPFF